MEGYCPTCGSKFENLKFFCIDCGNQLNTNSPMIKVSRNDNLQETKSPFISPLLNFILITAATILFSLQQETKYVFISMLLTSIFSLFFLILSIYKNIPSIICSSFITIGLQPPIIFMVVITISKNPQILTSMVSLIISLTYLIFSLICIISTGRSLLKLNFSSRIKQLNCLDKFNCSSCNQINLENSKFCTNCGLNLIDNFIIKLNASEQKKVIQVIIFSSLIFWSLIVIGSIFENNFLMTATVSQVFLTLLTLLFLLITGTSRDLYNQLKFTPLPIKNIIIAGVILFITLTVNFILSNLNLPGTKNIFKQETFFSSFSEPYLLVLVLSILPSLIEEIAFRGFIQKSLYNCIDTWPSILCTSFIFGLIHFNGFQILYAMILGLSLGWLYHRSRSLLLCIIVHCIHNLCVIFAGVL